MIRMNMRPIKAGRILVPWLVYYTLQLFDAVSARIPQRPMAFNTAMAGNQTIASEAANSSFIIRNADDDRNQTLQTNFTTTYAIDNTTEWPMNETPGQSLKPAIDNRTAHWLFNFSVTTVNTTNGTLDYPKSPSPETVTIDTWLTGPGGGLNSVSAGMANPRQATSESASIDARLTASVDNATQFLPTTEPEPALGRDNLPHAPLGHGLGHKPINYPALHVYRRLKDTADSSGAEIIAIFGLILCILFIICIFTVDLSTVRKDIKRIRYRRLGRSIHLDNMESLEVTEGWQRL